MTERVDVTMGCEPRLVSRPRERMRTTTRAAISRRPAVPPTAPPMAAPVESDDLETDAPTSEMFKVRGEAGGGANVGEGGGLVG